MQIVINQLDYNFMEISIIGAGYVGLSLAILISQKYEVTLFDIDKERVNKINKKISPIKDPDIEKYLLNKKLKLNTTFDSTKIYNNSDFVIIATPTNYDPIEGSFDTSSVEKTIADVLSTNHDSYIIIKSTVPLGFTDSMRNKFKTNKICFSPEFLREGSALHDNLFPSRIIVGDHGKKAKTFAKVLSECSKLNGEVETIFMKSSEAEAVKLFANTYLAMRVSFFNELDSFSQIHNLSTLNIINGVSSDPRIGNYYNNPSFGYGGYCLPKDTKQLLNNFHNVPNNIIKAIIDSNETRKKFITDSIIDSNPKTVGVYRLIMKTNSDNFRESAVLDIIKKLQEHKIQIVLYEPEIDENFNNMVLMRNLREFISKSDIVIANRLSKDLKFAKNKIYSRDIFGEN